MKSEWWVLSTASEAIASDRKFLTKLYLMSKSESVNTKWVNCLLILSLFDGTALDWDEGFLVLHSACAQLEISSAFSLLGTTELGLDEPRDTFRIDCDGRGIPTAILQAEERALLRDTSNANRLACLLGLALVDFFTGAKRARSRDGLCDYTVGVRPMSFPLPICDGSDVFDGIEGSAPSAFSPKSSAEHF